MLTILPNTANSAVEIAAWALTGLLLAYHLPGLKLLVAKALDKLYELFILKNTAI